MKPTAAGSGLLNPALGNVPRSRHFRIRESFSIHSHPGLVALVLLLALSLFLYSFRAFSFSSGDYVLPAGQAGLREDYNGDGSVDLQDVISLLLFARDNPRDPLADYNGDGRSSISDALSLLLNIKNGNLSAVGALNDDAVKNDPNIIFYEDFENQDIPTVDYGDTGGFYDLNGYPDQMYITGSEAAVGSHSLELIHPAGVISPQWMHRKFFGVDSIFVRFYRKYDKDYVWPPLGSHDTYIFAGNYNSPTSTDLTLYLDIPQGPVVRIDKGNWDLSRQPELVLKSSFQGPGLDFGLDREIISHDAFDNYYGLPYNLRPAPVMEAGRWYCFEYMAKMNSAPEAKDGEVRLWIDGRPVTEMKGLTLRNANHMYVQWNHWMLGPRYGGTNFETGPTTTIKSWIDAIAVSTKYIGTARR
ncbi:MAG: hypothetical protein V1794_17900 [Candidatus Glassbacteria bacterium]